MVREHVQIVALLRQSEVHLGSVVCGSSYGVFTLHACITVTFTIKYVMPLASYTSMGSSPHGTLAVEALQLQCLTTIYQW